MMEWGRGPPRSEGQHRRAKAPPPSWEAGCPGLAAHHLLRQLIHQKLVLLALLLHLLGLLVIVHGQLLQSLQHFLHLVLRGVIL